MELVKKIGGGIIVVLLFAVMCLPYLVINRIIVDKYTDIIIMPVLEKTGACFGLGVIKS